MESSGKILENSPLLIFLCRILSSIFLLHCIFYAQCQNETLERVNCLGYVNTTNYLLARFVN